MRDVIYCLRGTDFCPSHPFRGTIWGQNYEKNMKTGRKYGEEEKIQILIKSLIFRTLRIYIFSFYAFLFFVSFADAEFGKDGTQNFVRQDDAATGNLPDMTDDLPNIFAQQVGGQPLMQPLQSLFERAASDG